MTNFNNNFTDELRQRLSIVDIVGRRVPLVKKGNRLWGCCPFHNEKTPSFTVDESRGSYHCFGCGEHGDVISFVMKTENMDFKSAITELAGIAGIKMPDFKPKSPEQIKREETYFDITTAAANIYMDKLFQTDGEHALEYVRKRGFTDEILRKYKIGYAPKNNVIANYFSKTPFELLNSTGLARRGDYGNYDFFRDRLMFPIFNVHDKIVAFSGRSMDGTEPKYINTGDTEMFSKGKTVFGLNFAREFIHRANRTIVVEGQIDAIKMQIAGFGETVAPLGTALTDTHLAILCKLNRNITFCFDGDTAGQKAAARACGMVIKFIRDNSDIRFVFMPDKSDPDDVLTRGGADEMKKILGASIPLVDFLWNLANKNFVVSTPGGRVQAERFLHNELEKIEDLTLRTEFKKEYDSRKFNKWHKWNKSEIKNSKSEIPMPQVDKITQNTLINIINNYPEIAERHAEFLATLNIDFNNPNITAPIPDPERFIVSLKLARYLEKLQADKKDLTLKLLNGDSSARGALDFIETEIAKTKENQISISNS